jgi:hypothetical protein
VNSQGSLCSRRGSNGGWGAPEDREERVAFGPKIDPARVPDCGAKETPVLFEDRGPSLTECLEHSGRALDVRKTGT